MKTFWLYYNERPLTAVRADDTTPPEQIRARAIKQHWKVPLQPYGYAPIEWEHMLRMAEVRS